jgi:hypothetical protein
MTGGRSEGEERGRDLKHQSIETSIADPLANIFIGFILTRV